MPKSNYSATVEEVMALPLSNDNSDTSLDSHQSIKQTIDAIFQAKGMKVIKEEYRISNEGEFVQGIYTFEGGARANHNLMFTWVSTYNKTAGFKSSFGSTNGEIHYIISSKNNPQLKRVSIEGSLQHAIRLVNTQLTTAYKLFDEIMDYITGEEYKISIDRSEVSELVGEMFFNDMVTVTQLTKLREYMSNNFGIKSNKPFTITSGNYLKAALASTQLDNKPSKWIRVSTLINDYMMTYTKMLIEESNENVEDNTDTPVAIEPEKLEEKSIEYPLAEQPKKTISTDLNNISLSVKEENKDTPDFEF